ncbi:hypothetical protein Tco_0157512 [Tanacetum coccineum]
MKVRPLSFFNLTQPQESLNYNKKSPKVQKSIVEEEVRGYGITSMGNVSFEELMDQYETKEADKDDSESPFDRIMKEVNSDLESLPADDIVSVSGFEADETDDDDKQSEYKQEFSEAYEVAADNVLDELVEMANCQDKNINASAEKLSESDPLGHLHKEISSLTTKVQQFESSLTRQVADKMEDSVSRMVADAFEDKMLELLSNTLKNILPQIIEDSVKQTVKKSIKKIVPTFDKRVQKTFKTQINDLVIKPMNREYNAFNRMESSGLVHLQKQLSKAIRMKVGKFVQRNVKKEIKEVRDKFKYCIMKIDKNSSDIRLYLETEVLKAVYIHLQEQIILLFLYSVGDFSVIGVKGVVPPYRVKGQRPLRGQGAEPLAGAPQPGQRAGVEGEPPLVGVWGQ